VYIPMTSVLFVWSAAFAFVSPDGSRRGAVPVSLVFTLEAVITS
jgi:hypothetical protein